MFLKTIQLVNFKNYQRIKVDFNRNINIFYGNNAQGKTNLLESIYLLSHTTSHRVNETHQLIKHGSKRSKVLGTVKNDNFINKYNIILTDNRKEIMIDSNEVKKINEYIYSSIDVILFTPDDLDLIKGNPNIRRMFLNDELSKLSNNYYKLLNDYNKLLKIRNEYLKKMQINLKVDIDYFDIVTSYLVDIGISIYKIRKKFINKLSKISELLYANLTGDRNFEINYVSNFFDNEENMKLEFLQKLNEVKNKEIKTGSTMIGPHRDDFIFLLNKLDLKLYGSQGQQRAAILTIKLAEIDIYEKAKNRKPIILLDDVLSELDDTKKNRLLKIIDNNYQVFITATDLKKINKQKLSNANYYKISDGKIIKTEEVNNAK